MLRPTNRESVVDYGEFPVSTEICVGSLGDIGDRDIIVFGREHGDDFKLKIIDTNEEGNLLCRTQSQTILPGSNEIRMLPRVSNGEFEVLVNQRGEFAGAHGLSFITPAMVVRKAKEHEYPLMVSSTEVFWDSISYSYSTEAQREIRKNHRLEKRRERMEADLLLSTQDIKRRRQARATALADRVGMFIVDSLPFTLGSRLHSATLFLGNSIRQIADLSEDYNRNNN